MDEVLRIMDKYKKQVLVSTIILVILNGILIIAIDIEWFWLVLITLPLTTLSMSLYRDVIISSERFKGIMKSISILTICFSALFVSINVILSVYWLYGYLIPIYLVVQHLFLHENFKLPKLTEKDRLIMIYSIIMVFVLMLVLYIMPSFAANDGRNPNVAFNDAYKANDPYVIYSETEQFDREHIIAQSWFKTSFVWDYVNVIRSNKIANNNRGNLEFNNISKGKSTKVMDGYILVGYKNNDYFMPLYSYKGDVARIILYMYVTYRDDDNFPTDKISIDLMKAWSRLDPVDQKEIERNELIKKQGHFGNKFVSLPGLIGFII